MISALTDDSVVSQQTFGSWKIAIFFYLVWAQSHSPFAPCEHSLSSQGFTVEKREENFLSGDEVGTLRSIVVTLLDYDASGTEQLFCTCITIFCKFLCRT